MLLLLLVLMASPALGAAEADGQEWCKDVAWVLVAGFLVAFFLAFGTGANDVANTFGTSVGSGVISLRNACIVATVFEILGAALIGYKVSDTMRKGILDVNEYIGHEKELMMGCLSALTGSAVWLIVATYYKLPISGTHSIVGATVGFSLVARGPSGITWSKLLTIVASWFVSPVLSGLMSAALFMLIRYFIIRRPRPLIPGLRALPLIYGVTIIVNVFSIFHDGPKLLHFDKIPLWGSIVASLSIGVAVSLVVQCFVVPYLRKSIIESSRDHSPQQSKNISVEDMGKLGVITENIEITALSAANQLKANGNSKATNGFIMSDKVVTKIGENGDAPVAQLQGGLNSGNVTPAYGLSPNSSAVPLIRERVLTIQDPEAANGNLANGKAEVHDPPEVGRLFSFLQILTATFGSFAHGGNDVSNAIGPLVALWMIFKDSSVHQNAETPLAILLYGGVGISLGLWIWGRRVIQTIGEDLAAITPSTGFTIEIGAAFTVLLASKIGLPISTTHCKVGSVVFVGWMSSEEKGVDWKLFRNIIFAWLVTLPVAGSLSAACMFLLTRLAL
ncbi:sodium-dependent phosphate transporter 1 isoform X2 [Neocloeon triangulifer]|uniref:sodium-dependent phosphate transporter 1 isoform X2 n=1 Tax=Neocloeon triangulifer TaxID=2078957 RepID=UPI00286EE99D|nr:sodium-dependent phosphate transporter 1 isoform X2 [Neocloeon triangulifer]